MKSMDDRYFNVGPYLTLTFVVLIALILGGNGFLIWQFQIARLQTDRLTSVSRQLTAVLRLQETLLIFHQRLGEIAQSKDAHRFVTEAKPLLRMMLEQTQKTRNSLTRLPSDIPVDPLEVIEVALPSQLDGITALAKSGDWEAVNLRLVNQLKPMETQTSALVERIDLDVSEAMTQAVTNMKNVQRRVVLIVPTTAALTFFIASFFAWAVTRRILELRFEERLAERTRIAQELHDTLLQGVISASMQLHVVEEQMPSHLPAKTGLQRVVDLMGRVIEEGRNALSGLRSTDGSAVELGQALSRVQQEFAGRNDAEFHVIVEGLPRLLHPGIRDEIYSIGREALTNAFRHSQARTIEVELEYASDELRVLVRDNGVGFDPKVLQLGRDGHWGLSGMRERAKRIGARLRVLTREAAGTEVELTVPSRISYILKPSGRASN